MRKKIIACALVLSAASAAAGPAAGSGRAALQVRHTRLGRILVDRRGYTLYAFTPDRAGRDTCVKVPNCIGAWPVVGVKGPLAGAGVRASLIGRIRVRGVGWQLTYAGHPLYTYVGDTYPGEISNVNLFQFGGYWPAISPGGREVR